MPSLVNGASETPPKYLRVSHSLGKVVDLYQQLPNEGSSTTKIDKDENKEQTSSELMAAAKFLCEEKSEASTSPIEDGSKEGEDKEDVSGKEEKGGEKKELLRVVQDSATRDTPRATRLLALGFLEAMERLEENAPNAGSLQGCMQVLHLRLVQTGHLEGGAFLDLVKKLSSSARFGHLRLLFLSLIYNSVEESKGGLRLFILVHTIHLAMMAGLSWLLLPGILGRVEEFVGIWKLDKEEIRKLYRVITLALEKDEDDVKAHAWNMKYLQTFTSNEVVDDEEVKKIARKAIIDGIRLKTMYRFDSLMDIEAIKALKSKEDCESLYALSEVFVNGSVHDYVKWHDDVVKKNGGKKVGEIDGLVGVEHEVCLEKMRLLTFSSMGIEAQEMSYEEVAKGLSVEKSDVEDWVVKAIGAGLVDAKMDQLEEKVRVYRSTQRTFTRAEWAPLSDRINVWKANVADLLEALKATRQASKIAAEAGKTEIGL